MQSFLRKIQIDIATQQLHLLERPVSSPPSDAGLPSPEATGAPEEEREEPWRLVASFPISSSAHGLGSEPGSLKTPLGRFTVAEKIGDDAPLGAVFKSRVPTGDVAAPENPGSDDDLVTTRILWLSGVESHNANTRERYIYIHGTNHEESIGEPTSHGCIRMRNTDIAWLYNAVGPGTEVVIELPGSGDLRESSKSA